MGPEVAPAWMEEGLVKVGGPTLPFLPSDSQVSKWRSLGLPHSRAQSLSVLVPSSSFPVQLCAQQVSVEVEAHLLALVLCIQTGRCQLQGPRRSRVLSRGLGHVWAAPGHDITSTQTGSLLF